jgi:hypothetical protein
MNLRLDLLALISAAELVGTGSAFAPRGSSQPLWTTPRRSSSWPTVKKTTAFRVAAATATVATERQASTAGASASAKPTGTSFLPPETIERAKKGNPVEKLKLQKDGTSAFGDVYEYARKIREGTLSWDEIEKNDLESVSAKGGVTKLHGELAREAQTAALRQIQNLTRRLAFSLSALERRRNDRSGSSGWGCCTGGSGRRGSS